MKRMSILSLLAAVFTLGRATTTERKPRQLDSYSLREMAGELTPTELAEVEREELENYERNLREARAWMPWQDD